MLICILWQDARELWSVGGGLHVVQLLVLGAFAGSFALEKFHPKIINDFSLSLVLEILKYAPKGMVPGNTVGKQIVKWCCCRYQLHTRCKLTGM